jgi:hypothetical protein
MILDRTETFSNAQAITATTASTNVIDTGQPGTVYGAATALRRDLGKGNAVPLALSVVQSFNNLTSFNVQYQVADDAAFTQNLTTTFVSPTYSLADMQAGARYHLPDAVPVGSDRRYHRLLYTVTGTNPTLGQITAGFVAARQSNTIL